MACRQKALAHGVKVKFCVWLATIVMSFAEGGGVWVVYTVVGVWAELWTVYIFATADCAAAVGVMGGGMALYGASDGAPVGSVILY